MIGHNSSKENVANDITKVVFGQKSPYMVINILLYVP